MILKYNPVKDMENTLECIELFDELKEVFKIKDNNIYEVKSIHVNTDPGIKFSFN